jgi:hypothetical protein
MKNANNRLDQVSNSTASTAIQLNNQNFMKNPTYDNQAQLHSAREYNASAVWHQQ